MVNRYPNEYLARTHEIILKIRRMEGDRQPLEKYEVIKQKRKTKKKEGIKKYSDNLFNRDIAIQILKAFGRRVTECDRCGREQDAECTLHLHHLDKRQYLALAYDPSNILVLCPKCHAIDERRLEKLRKKNDFLVYFFSPPFSIMREKKS